MGRKKRDVRPADESVEDGGEWWVFQGRTRTYAAPMPALTQLSSATMCDLYWVAFQVLQSIEAQTDPISSIKVEAKSSTRWPVFRLPDPLPKVAKLALDLLNHCVQNCDELDPDTWDRQADATAGYLAGQLRLEPDADIGRTRHRVGKSLGDANKERRWNQPRDKIVSTLKGVVRRYPGKRKKTFWLNKAAESKSLKISRKTLVARMKEHGIQEEEWCKES